MATETKGNEGDETEAIKKNICYAFGDKDGKALIESVEKNPLKYMDDKRPIVVEFAKLTTEMTCTENAIIKQLMNKVKELTARVDAMESGSNEIPIDITLGPFKYSPKLEYTIPKEIPDNAKKVLIYVTFESGQSSRDIFPNITILSAAKDGKIHKNYLNTHTYNQNAWSYNSDNFWIPMPKDKKIIVTQAKEYTGNAGGVIRIIRYTI